MSEAMTFHGTTVFAIRRDHQAAMAADGQVTMGESTIMKQGARKVRRLYHDRVIAGFAGSVADAQTLFELYEEKLETYHGSLQRGAIELAKLWRTDRMLRQLNALLVVLGEDGLLVVSGTGEVIEPDDGMIGIGSGGNFALAAGRALAAHTEMPAEALAKEAVEIAADICVYTNHQIRVESLQW